jgi:predicted ester cyclase
VREFTQSPVGPLPPNNQRVTFDLINIFQFDDDGRFVNDYVRLDNQSVLAQLGYMD